MFVNLDDGNAEIKIITYCVRGAPASQTSLGIPEISLRDVLTSPNEVHKGS